MWWGRWGCLGAPPTTPIPASQRQRISNQGKLVTRLMQLHSAQLRQRGSTGDPSEFKLEIEGFDIDADAHQWSGKSSFPATVGNFDYLAPAHNIGAVTVPYSRPGHEVPGDNGVAIVTKVDNRLSVSANLTNAGAVRFAWMLLERCHSNLTTMADLSAMGEPPHAALAAAYESARQALAAAHESTRLALVEVIQTESRQRSVAGRR